jgi:PAS domain S-box-containing protein
MVQRADRQLREVLLQQTRLVAQALNVERVQTLSGDASDPGNPNYLRLKRQFAAIKQGSDRCRFVYHLSRRADGRIVFLVDNEPPNSKDYSPPGQVYEEASEAIHRVFVSGSEAVAGPMEDRWGGWVTALVPLRDPQTESPIAVLAMDVDARAWRWTVLLAAAWPVGLMLAVLALLILSAVLARSRRRILSHQEAIRAKSEELERYFSQSLDLLCLASTDGRFLRLNPEWEKTLGYSIAELENRVFLDFVHPDDLAATREAVSRLSDQETILNFENRYRHRDGSYRWIEWRSIPQGTLIYAAARDITDRKQTEQALSESERYLRAILQTAADGFWVIDCGGYMVEVNDAYCAMTGYRREEILGLSIGVLDADETPGETASRIERIIAKGTETFETRHCRKNGEVFPMEVSATFVRERGGQFVCFGRDLSERRQREERIALLGRMLDEAPASITIHDTDGRFLFANRATFALHGYEDPEAFLAINLHDLDVPESEANLAERFRRIAEEGEARFEVAHHRRDGSTFPLEVLAKAIEWNGRPAVLSIAADITERKRVEEALRLTQFATDRASDSILWVDEDGSLVYVNDTACSSMGYTREELLKMKVFDIDPDFPPDRWEEHKMTMRRLGAMKFESRHRTRDGRTYPVEVTTNYIEYHGQFFACAFDRDISERKRAEQALGRERERLQFIIDGSRLGTWEWNIQTNETVFNETWAQTLGYTIEELTPYNYETWRSLVCPEDRGKHGIG